MHYFTAGRKDFFGSDRIILVCDLKEKKLEGEVFFLTTPAQSKLEPKITWWKILSLSTWAICELTNAGGKRSIKPVSVAMDYGMHTLSTSGNSWTTKDLPVSPPAFQSL